MAKNYSFFYGKEGGGSGFVPLDFLAGLGQGVGNALTGDLDYARTLETQEIANAFTAQENAKNREFQANQAQIARDWDERMSNTAYQRQAADMRAAGINPYASLSSGAAVPSSPSPSGSSGGGSSGSAFSSSKGVSALIQLFGGIIGSAFTLAKSAQDNASRERIAQVKADNAYELARYKVENTPHNVKSQLYDEDGKLRSTIFRDWK